MHRQGLLGALLIGLLALGPGAREGRGQHVFSLTPASPVSFATGVSATVNASAPTATLDNVVLTETLQLSLEYTGAPTQPPVGRRCLILLGDLDAAALPLGVDTLHVDLFASGGPVVLVDSFSDPLAPVLFPGSPLTIGLGGLSAEIYTRFASAAAAGRTLVVQALYEDPLGVGGVRLTAGIPIRPVLPQAAAPLCISGITVVGGGGAVPVTGGTIRVDGPNFLAQTAWDGGVNLLKPVVTLFPRPNPNGLSIAVDPAQISYGDDGVSAWLEVGLPALPALESPVFDLEIRNSSLIDPLAPCPTGANPPCPGVVVRPSAGIGCHTATSVDPGGILTPILYDVPPAAVCRVNVTGVASSLGDDEMVLEGTLASASAEVTITGANFRNGATVEIAGFPVPILSVAAESIVIEAPAGCASNSVPLIVQNADIPFLSNPPQCTNQGGATTAPCGAATVCARDLRYLPAPVQNVQLTAGSGTPVMLGTGILAEIIDAGTSVSSVQAYDAEAPISIQLSAQNLLNGGVPSAPTQVLVDTSTAPGIVPAPLNINPRDPFDGQPTTATAGLSLVPGAGALRAHLGVGRVRLQNDACADPSATEAAVPLLLRSSSAPVATTLTANGTIVSNGVVSAGGATGAVLQGQGFFRIPTASLPASTALPQISISAMGCVNCPAEPLVIVREVDAMNNVFFQRAEVVTVDSDQQLTFDLPPAQVPTSSQDAQLFIVNPDLQVSAPITFRYASLTPEPTPGLVLDEAFLVGLANAGLAGGNVANQPVRVRLNTTPARDAAADPWAADPAVAGASYELEVVFDTYDETTQSTRVFAFEEVNLPNPTLLVGGTTYRLIFKALALDETLLGTELVPQAAPGSPLILGSERTFLCAAFWQLSGDSYAPPIDPNDPNLLVDQIARRVLSGPDFDANSILLQTPVFQMAPPGQVIPYVLGRAGLPPAGGGAGGSGGGIEAPTPPTFTLGILAPVGSSVLLNGGEGSAPPNAAYQGGPVLSPGGLGSTLIGVPPRVGAVGLNRTLPLPLPVNNGLAPIDPLEILDLRLTASDVPRALVFGRSRNELVADLGTSDVEGLREELLAGGTGGGGGGARQYLTLANVFGGRGGHGGGAAAIVTDGALDLRDGFAFVLDGGNARRGLQIAPIQSTMTSFFGIAANGAPGAGGTLLMLAQNGAFLPPTPINGMFRALSGAPDDDDGCGMGCNEASLPLPKSQSPADEGRVRIAVSSVWADGNPADFNAFMTGFMAAYQASTPLPAAVDFYRFEL